MRRNIVDSLLMLAAAGLLPAAASVAAIPPEAAASAQPRPAASAPHRGKPVAASELVDINSAGKDALKKLPGIGDAEAAKIIAGRPYLSKADLVTSNIIPQGVYLTLKDKIIAKQKQTPKGRA
jgi:competence protein ComEA